MSLFTLALALAILPLSISALPVATTTAAATTCEDVHLFLSRGTGEDYPGRQISIVYAVCNGTIGTDVTCGYENIQYPATIAVPECKSPPSTPLPLTATMCSRTQRRALAN